MRAIRIKTGLQEVAEYANQLFGVSVADMQRHDPRQTYVASTTTAESWGGSVAEKPRIEGADHSSISSVRRAIENPRAVWAMRGSMIPGILSWLRCYSESREVQLRITPTQSPDGCDRTRNNGDRRFG